MRCLHSVHVLLGMVFACAVCGSAERGLPANGVEVAFDGRKRATLDVRAVSFATRDDAAVEVRELRAEAGAAATVADATMVGVAVPLLRRSIDAGGASRADTILGDVELRVTHTVLREIGRHLSLDLGLKLPTAPIQRDPTGQELTPDLQPGCSSLAPLAGATYRWTSGRILSAWSSLSLLMPFGVRSDAPHPGDSLRAATTVQIDAASVFAARLGAYARYDTTGERDGAAVARSGGAAVYVAPEIVLAPTKDIVVSMGAAFPAVQATRAYRATSPVVLASVGVDF